MRYLKLCTLCHTQCQAVEWPLVNNSAGRGAGQSLALDENGLRDAWQETSRCCCYRRDFNLKLL